MKYLSISLLLVVATISIGKAEIIYVNQMAKGKNDGSSWENAYTDLQDALTWAQTGDHIWIAAGVYSPTADADRTAVFLIERGIELIGGFFGNEMDAGQRNWSVNRTTLSGNIGDPESREDNVYHVIECKAPDSIVVLDGLTVTGAYNDRDNSNGSGVILDTTHAIIVNCRIARNSGKITGGIYAFDSPLTVRNSIIARNEGIGCLLEGSPGSFNECLFRRNSSAKGGAIHAYNGGLVTAFSSRFIGNRASLDGGAYYGFGDSVLESCVFARNKAGGYGGAMFLHNGRPRITNCTIVKNWSDFNVGGIHTFSENSQPEIRNCVLWGNRSANGMAHGWVEKDQAVLLGGTMKQCLVEGYTGLYGGRSNFDADPMFVDADARNLRLRATSPAIGRGKDDVVIESQDLDDNPRILSSRVDLGAWENVCKEIRDFDVDAREHDEGGFDVVASFKTHLPASSTVRVVFTLLDENGNERASRTRRALITQDGSGKVSFPNCTEGSMIVCVEGCGESLCREVRCP